MIRTIRFFFCVVFSLLLLNTRAVSLQAGEAQPSRLSLHWEKNYLTISSPTLAGGELKIHYLEAYCCPGLTDREWGKTVIGPN